MLNSIKQIFRTPFKLILFLLLTTVSTALLTAGFSLWLGTTRKLAELEQQFTTVGTVTQKPSVVKTSGLWDAALGSYQEYLQPEYDTVLPLSVLNFDGADYIKGPEKRPFYGAYMPDFTPSVPLASPSMQCIVEFSPVEDCVPDHPVRVNIKKILYGEDIFRDSTNGQFSFCDHFTENPEALTADKTYIAGMQFFNNTHTKDRNLSVGGIEFVPIVWPDTSQYDPDGILLEATGILGDGKRWEEVTENFYAEGRGRYWRNLAESYKKLEKTVQVVPTESLDMLPSFHVGKSVPVVGREITEEEFERGNSVCMVSQEFAELNGLKARDAVTLSLYFTNKNIPHNFGFNYLLLNSQGEVYFTFWKAEYEIVGIYKYNAYGQQDWLKAELGPDTILIPSKSVRASDENNIVDYGPMHSLTTSFQIPNGSIAEFEAAFRVVPESQYLEISFDDKGYGAVSRNIKEARDTALLLCGAGSFSGLAVLLLLLYFFVIRQKRRTAMELSLGMTKRQCRVSLAGGILVLTLAGAVLGSLGSGAAAGWLGRAAETGSGMAGNGSTGNGMAGNGSTGSGMAGSGSTGSSMAGSGSTGSGLTESSSTDSNVMENDGQEPQNRGFEQNGMEELTISRTIYSNWTEEENAAEGNMTGAEAGELFAVSWQIRLIVPIIVVLFMLLLSLLFINRNLKAEPVALLSEKES